MADDFPSREDAHAALTALCAGAYGPKGGRKDYVFHLSSYHALVLMQLFDNLEAKCRQNRLESDPTPTAPDPHITQADIDALEAVYRWAMSDPRSLLPVADAVERCYALAKCLAHQIATSRQSSPSNTVSDNGIAVRIGAAPDQAEGPRESRGDDVDRVTSRAEESVIDKGVFRYDTDKTRLGAPSAPWDPSHREIL